MCVLWHIPKVFSRAFRGDCLWSHDMCVAVVVQVIGGESHLRGNGCAEHVRSVIFYGGEGLCKAVWVRSNQPTGGRYL